MKIKTITEKITESIAFDRRVNEALADGWILEKKYISTPPNGNNRFIAELVKDKEAPGND